MQVCPNRFRHIGQSRSSESTEYRASPPRERLILGSSRNTVSPYLRRSFTSGLFDSANQFFASSPRTLPEAAHVAREQVDTASQHATFGQRTEDDCIAPCQRKLVEEVRKEKPSWHPTSTIHWLRDLAKAGCFAGMRLGV
jgi:hypothetical protein